MFGRKKKESGSGSQDSSGSGGPQIGSGVPPMPRSGGTGATPRGVTPRGSHPTPRTVDQEAFRRLRELLEGKCDEVDDLSNNLKLAKESLRHLSDRLDRTSEELVRSKERESALAAENGDLRKSLGGVNAATDEKMEMAARLERGLRRFQENLAGREAKLREDREKFQMQLKESMVELDRREHRIHRLTTCVDDMEEGVAVGRVHVKKLSALLAQ